MMSASMGNHARIAALAARGAARAALLRLSRTRLMRWRFTTNSSDRLLLAPQDIRTADPIIANEIYGGRFSLAGRMAHIEHGSPFTAEPPSPEWSRALHGFEWLRHLRASNSALARSQARALIDDWIANAPGWRETFWSPEIAARRIISWLSHAPMILDGADREYYRRFFRALARQVRYLRKTATLTQEGLPRLTAVIALNYAALCMSQPGKTQRRAARWLDDELSRQILADGGHVSRNPGVIVELLLDLLPLRQTFAAREIAPSTTLVSAIDRMMPMLRFFRHSDGEFALFNGMGASPADAIATVLAYDDVLGKPFANASHSGYQRAIAGHATLLMDTGKPPPLAYSGKAHAGCLSFEFAAGRHRIIVNCGHPLAAGSSWQRAARLTAAHSTATLGETSSCRFSAPGRLAPSMPAFVLSGPGQVTAERTDRETAQRIVASHDGYRRAFGVTHERTLDLAADGTALAGQDLFRLARRHSDIAYAVRFHLHPDVRTARAESGNGLLLMLPNRETWSFQVKGMAAEIEESVYLPEGSGPRRSEQIVIRGRVGARPQIDWLLKRVRAASGMPAGARQQAPEQD